MQFVRQTKQNAVGFFFFNYFFNKLYINRKEINFICEIFRSLNCGNVWIY